MTIAPTDDLESASRPLQRVFTVIRGRSLLGTRTHLIKGVPEVSGVWGPLCRPIWRTRIPSHEGIKLSHREGPDNTRQRTSAPATRHRQDVLRVAKASDCGPVQSSPAGIVGARTALSSSVVWLAGSRPTSSSRFRLILMLTKAWLGFEVVLVCVRRGLAVVHPETAGGGGVGAAAGG